MTISKHIFRWFLILHLTREVCAKFPLIKKDLASHGDEKSILLATRGALNDILEVDRNPLCSVAFVMKAATEHLSLLKIMSTAAAPSGVSLVLISTDKEENRTWSELQQQLQQTKKLRDSAPCLTVIVASEDTAFLSLFGRASKAVQLLKWPTRMLVVTNLSFLKLRGLLSKFPSFTDTNSMAVTLRSFNGSIWCDVHSYLPYSPVGPQLRLIASWTPKARLSVMRGAVLFPPKYDNFYGASKWVTAIMIAPYLIKRVTKTAEGAEVEQISGRENLLLEAVAENMNVTFTFKKVNQAGEMAVDVKKGAFAAVMRVAMLPAFLEAADFTEFIQEATFTFAMAKPTLKPQWQGLYYPLTHAVWACVLLFMVTMPFFMIVVAENDYSDKSRSNYWRDRKFSLVFSAFGMFFSQSLCDLPATFSSRVLVFSWLIFAFIIGTVYRGNLTAFLTIPKYPPRIDTLEQLADSTSRAKFRPNSSSFYQYFQESELSSYRRVYQRADLIATVTIGLREAMINSAAYFQERMNMDLEIARHYPYWKDRSKLYIAKENVMPGFAAWMVPKDGPYVENLNKVIRAARESGLLQKWTEDVMRYEKRQIFFEQQNDLTEMSAEETDDVSADGGGDGGDLALTVVHMQGPLILLVLGLAMATVSFLAEVVVHYCSRRFLGRRRT